jgi:hypothetical protein
MAAQFDRFRKHCSNLTEWSCCASARQTLVAALV